MKVPAVFSNFPMQFNLLIHLHARIGSIIGCANYMIPYFFVWSTTSAMFVHKALNSP